MRCPSQRRRAHADPDEGADPEHREREQEQQAIAAAACAALAWMCQPTSRPPRLRMMMPSVRSPAVLKACGRAGTTTAAIGRLRKRSTTPSVRSVASAVAGPIIPNVIVCTSTPPIRRAVAARHRDHAAEHVAEQQHEHERLERHVHQLFRDLLDVLEVAPREHKAVGAVASEAEVMRRSPGGRRSPRARVRRCHPGSARVAGRQSLDAGAVERAHDVDQARAAADRRGHGQALAVAVSGSFRRTARDRMRLARAGPRRQRSAPCARGRSAP